MTSFAIIISMAIAAALSQAPPPAEITPTEITPAGITAETITLDAAIDGLQTRYQEVSDFKAKFKQVVTRKHLPRPLKKSGTVYFKKPGMMRWDYTQPDKVYYVSDGDVLWSYQPADKLAYKLKVKDSELYDALKFLFGQGNLRAEFNITRKGVEDGLLVLHLVPKKAQTNYKDLTVYVNVTTFEIARTELVDPLDNVSAVTFIDPTYEVLKVKGFKFKPPKGVNVQNLANKQAATPDAGSGEGGATP